MVLLDTCSLFMELYNQNGIHRSEIVQKRIPEYTHITYRIGFCAEYFMRVKITSNKFTLFEVGAFPFNSPLFFALYLAHHFTYVTFLVIVYEDLYSYQTFTVGVSLVYKKIPPRQNLRFVANGAWRRAHCCRKLHQSSLKFMQLF